MIKYIDLSGEWSFLLSAEKPDENAVCTDKITLPSTVQQMKKPPVTDERSAGYLTDPYRFDGYAVYERKVNLGEIHDGARVYFIAERTRTTALTVNGKKAECGEFNSLCAFHRYDITDLCDVETALKLTVDNVSCPVPGGHLTSQDTQTNWLGVTGKIGIEILNGVRFENVKVYPDIENETVTVKGQLVGAESAQLEVSVNGFGAENIEVTSDKPEFVYEMKGAQLWSEHNPVVYTLKINCGGDVTETDFGMREFKTRGMDFLLNGEKIFLRGKHDGMIFPMTGAAPADKDGWLKVMKAAKEHGINHYRFHTCCPPEAAFCAADELGIYMEPELPFWGTIEEEITDGQQYLIDEGYRILDSFGNHPSFFAMSLGNELWGSQERLNAILGGYKQHDSRHLYTQGSNNFQFWPCIVDNDDFFTGVRFSKERLFRGSYAMCDAPQGHIQTNAPNSDYTYDEHIRPAQVNGEASGGGTIEIQYGTGVKTVSMTNASGELIPNIPVVSHEVGQYFMYPDYNEIEKYTGVLKPYNLEIFRERLEEAGLLDYADSYFKASGRFAAECYKNEIETALRSNTLSGFQLLDIQDFTGQGTALVGILNSFMESKGVISPEEWREFCSEKVILGCLDRFVFKAGEKVKLAVKLCNYSARAEVDPAVKITLGGSEYTLNAKGSFKNGTFDLGCTEIEMPSVNKAEKAVLKLECGGVKNSYDLWVFPEVADADFDGLTFAKDWETAEKALIKGEKVLFMPEKVNENYGIEGTYCTDFWNYPMFASISRSMNKPEPVGTLGLLIEKNHPVFESFPTEIYSTAQWYDVVTDSSAAVLDGMGIKSILRTIDNCERNHDLGTLFEVNVGNGKLMVCTAKLDEKKDSLPCRQLLSAIAEYMKTDKFVPEQTVDLNALKKIFA